MADLVTTLMIRDGLTFDEAKKQVEELRGAVQEAIMAGEDPEDVLLDMAGLEPDYLLELLDW